MADFKRAEVDHLSHKGTRAQHSPIYCCEARKGLDLTIEGRKSGTPGHSLTAPTNHRLCYSKYVKQYKDGKLALLKKMERKSPP